MGKQYYCDYCERSFADGAENRKKHLASVHHQKFRKAHYDMFKSASEILEGNKFKKPCRKFDSTGYCEFGVNCKYSHLTPLDIQNLQHQASLDQMGCALKNPPPTPNIDAWLQSKLLKTDKTAAGTSTGAQTALPSILSAIPNLPPSLIPSRPSEFISSGKNATLQWG